MFRHLPPKVFLRAYTALVRPVLESCIQVWFPTTLGDMATIEDVERMAPQLVPALRMFPHEVRLAILGLFSMRRRRRRGVLLRVFEILEGTVRIGPARFFTLRPPCNRRGALPYVTETHSIDGS